MLCEGVTDTTISTRCWYELRVIRKKFHSREAEPSQSSKFLLSQVQGRHRWPACPMASIPVLRGSTCFWDRTGTFMWLYNSARSSVRGVTLLERGSPWGRRAGDSSPAWGTPTCRDFPLLSYQRRRRYQALPDSSFFPWYLNENFYEDISKSHIILYLINHLY